MTGVTVKPHIPLQTINTNVQVAVRLRPLLETDSRRSGQNGARPVVEIKYKPEDNKTNNNQCGDLFIHTATSTATVADNGRQGVVWIDQKRAFGFDKVFDEFTTQEQLFAGCGRQLAQDFVDGCNVTLFAYGQTGSGKTFSLMQHAAVRESAAAAEDNLEDGLVSKTAQYILELIASKICASDYTGSYSSSSSSKESTFKLTVSFIQVYNDDLFDLLNPPCTIKEKRSNPNWYQKYSQIISIREASGTGEIFWTGAKQAPVENIQQILSLLTKGLEHRATSSTDLNYESSRSHAIFSLNLHQSIWIPDISNSSNNVGAEGRGVWQKLDSKFHFVDLAGSERMKRTGAVGERQREGISINYGLLALGNVIHALSSESSSSLSTTITTSSQQHIPYRESKLTRLLQDSLGGNSKTLMLACISPTFADAQETTNTLKYATRARNIRNTVSVNSEYVVDVDSMKDEISALRAELAALRNNTISSSILVSPNTAITSSSSSNSNNSNNNFPPAYISWDFSDTESLCSNGTDASHIGSSIPVPLKRASTLSSVVSSSLPSSSPSKQYSHHHQQQHVDLNYETFISKLKKQLKEATHSAEMFSRQVDMLKADVVEKTNLLDSLHAENQDLSAKVSRLSDKHNDMQEYMIQLESDHESVTTSVSQLKIQNAALVSKNKDAEEYITGLESQLVSRDAMEQLIKHLEEQVSNASSGATAVATNASLPASSSLSTIPLDKGVQRHNDTDHLHTAIINSSSRSSIEVTPPASPPPPPSQTTDSSVLCKIITQDDAQRYNELNTEYMEDIKSWEIASKMFEAQIEGLITKLKTHQDREESLIRELEEFKQQQKQHEVTPNDNTPMTSSLARSVAVDQENHESLEQVPPLYSAPELCHEAASTSRDFDEDPCHCKEVLDQARDILIKNHHLDDGKSPSLPIAESSSYISSSAQLLLSSIQCLVESHLQQQQDLETTRSAIALAQLAVLPSCTSSHAEVQTEYIGVTESGNQTLVSALSCQLSESSSQTGFGDHTGDADTQTSFVIHEEPERRDAEMQTSEHIIFELSTQTDSSTYSDGECQYESSRLDMIENGTQTAIVHCEESFCQYELDISFGMDESDTQTVRISYADGFTQSDIDSSPQESSSRDVDLDIQSGSSYVAALLVDSSCQYELLPSSPSAEVADVELQTLESSFLSNSSCHAQTEADQEKLVNTVDAECQYSTSDSFTLSSCGFLMDADIQTDMTVFTDSASQHETEAESVLISATSTSSDLRAVKESRSLSSTIDSKDAACQHESEFSNVNSIATDTNGLLLLSASEIQTISILGFNDSADAIVQTECFPVTSDTSTLTDYAVDEFKNVFPISRGLAPDGASISRESMSLMEQQASIKRLETELDELKRQVHDKSEIIRRISSTSTSFSASVDDNSNLIGVWKRLSDSEKIIKSQSETLDKMQTRIWEQETTISIYKENKTSQQTLQLEQLAIMEKENLRLSDLIAELVQSKSGASNLSSLSSSSKSSMRAKSVHSVESEVNVTTMMDLEVMEAMEQQRDLEVKNLQAKLDQARATIDEMKSEEAATRQRGLLDDCDRAHEEVEQLRQDVVDRFNEYKAKRAAKDLSIYEAFAKEKNHLEQLVEEKTGQLEETSEKLKQLELAKEQVTDLMRRLTRDLETKNVALTKFSADNKALLAQNMILKRDLEEERARPSSIAVRGEDCHDDEEKSSVFNPITPAAVPAPVLDRKFEMELEAKFLALEEVVETRVLNLEHDLAEAKKRIESLNARIFESGSVFQQERAGLESIIQELESQLSIKEAELEFFINAKETMLTHLEDERSHLLQENDLLRLSLQDQEQQPQQPQQLQLCTDPKFYNSRMKELPPLVVSHVQVQTNEKHGDVLLCDTSSQTELINSIDQQKRIDSQMDEIANLGYELTRSQTVIRDLKKSLKLLDTDVVIARRESQTPGGATVAHPPISLASSSGKSLVLSAQDYLSLLSDSDGEDGGSGGGGGILPPILLHEADIDGINATSDSSAVDSELRNAVPEILPSLMFPETATVVSRSTVRNSLMEYRSQIREQEEEVERSRRKTLDLQSRLTNLTYENHHLHFRYENVRRELELRKKETSTTRSAWRRISNLFKLSKLTGRRRADSLDF